MDATDLIAPEPPAAAAPAGVPELAAETPGASDRPAEPGPAEPGIAEAVAEPEALTVPPVPAPPAAAETAADQTEVAADASEAETTELVVSEPPSASMPADQPDVVAESFEPAIERGDQVVGTLASEGTEPDEPSQPAAPEMPDPMQPTVPSDPAAVPADDPDAIETDAEAAETVPVVEMPVDAAPVTVGAAAAPNALADGPAAPDGGEPVATGPADPPLEVEAPPAIVADLPPSTAVPAETATPGVVTPVVPAFDAIRVNRAGILSAAGRGPPLAEIRIYDGSTVIGTTEADAAGQWVFIASTPLDPGGHEIRFEAVLPGSGRLIPGDAGVLVLVPERPMPTPTLEPPAVVAAEVPEEAAEPDVDGAMVAADAAVAPQEAGDPIILRTPGGEAGPTELLQGPGGAAGQGSETVEATIEIVDYAEPMGLIVSGRAPPGALVRLYVDEEAAGEAVADGDGKYRLALRRRLPVGNYRLRIDVVDAAGVVTARAETLYLRWEEVARTDGSIQLVVRPGNSLWRLARRVYGAGIQYTVIYEHNREQIRDPDLIYPGQVLTVPVPWREGEVGYGTGDAPAADRP